MTALFGGLPLAVVGLSLGTMPAQASFPGTNGKIYYADSATGNGDIYAVNPDGVGVVQLTSTADRDSNLVAPRRTAPRSLPSGTRATGTSTP
ncbi:hypothetical protein [Embleya sp. MST-111070]|uniref:hypothetical protein n=1 Tax=Embleya sp. MST-111070 TaxID=3398231 RepID=UPI003F73AE2C